MPLLDRCWQARVALAAFLAFVAVAFAVRFLPIAYVVDQRRHIAFWPDALVTVGICSGLLACAIYYLWSIRRARARMWWREGALYGPSEDIGVQALHYLVSEPQSPLPLTLMWRQGWAYRIVGALGAFCSLMSAFVGGLFLYRTVFALIQNDVLFVSGFVGVGGSFGMLIPPFAGLFCAVYFLRPAWESWRPAIIITANEEGVTRRKGYSKRFIRWEDLRLLEVITYRPLNKRLQLPKDRLLLYSRDNAISWDDVYSRQATYRQRTEFLAVVERRAHLRVRAFKQPKR
ncbi:MAG TPA: hypothetical protein VMV29_23780 [Ktedonobacterales bacterium]|nr:hypothetical protein [Ktedonobacterales bacterium]